MRADHEAMKQKHDQIRRVALSKVPEAAVSDRSAIVDKLFKSYIQLSAPMYPDVEISEWITIESMGRDGGRSRKPGNIILNWRKLIQFVPDLTITAAGLAGPTWLLPFIDLHIWNKLCAGSKVDLDQKHAVTIYALWRNRNNERKISEEAGFEKTNSILRELKLEELSKSEYTKIINDLLDMDCIEIEEGIIWLREWVRTTY